MSITRNDVPIVVILGAFSSFVPPPPAGHFVELDDTTHQVELDDITGQVVLN